ncbi:hypothetical protein Tco_0783038 [Tanacetum coccineum]
MRHGFDLGYKTWVHHGEPDLPPPPPVIDNTRQPQMSDMTALLNDLSYIPPNNEHNEPTQGDIGETSNEPNQATRNEFEELYASANEELHPGCDYVTRLDFMAKFTYFKVKGKLIDSIFNEMLEFFQNVFPISKGYKLLPSYYAIKTLQGMPTCNKDTPSVRVLSKTAYVGHRRFLKKPHKWRRSLEFNGQTDNTDPPKEFGRDVILAQLDRLPTRVKGKHPSYGGVKIKRNVHVELNWTKRSIFYELEYWSFLSLRHNLDIMHIEKNVLEAILNTLLMNDKSKDTAKARQDLQMLGIRSGLWLGQTKNGKCLKPQAAYSFTPENRKKFCQYIKGVKLPDGFGSCFKHKVTDNDTNITGLKSHDCHIMMQRLLPYGLQNYLPDKIAKPIIELCSLFKQICSATLMEDDMLKAQIKVVDILCDLELIYPPALFDIMIHLVIHLPLEALEGGPICPQWMFPFERYMMKLKGYVQNKAKPEGSIAEGYVAEEVLTFSSFYFRDVTTKFNRPDRNVDPPPPTCQFQICQRHVDNDKDPEVSTTSELFALACGPTWTPSSINSCVVDGVRYVVHNRDERHTTQNSGICAPDPDEEMYYGRKVKRLVLRNNMTQINCKGEAFKNDQYILVTQVKQVLYLEDKAKPYWRVVEHINHKKFSDEGVIVVEDDPDIIHFDNSSDLPLSTSLNDLDNATLHIDGQSTKVDAPLDIIDVVDQDDDITDDEDALPHDLADSDDKDLINVDDDGVDKMLADVARSHGGDGGGEDRPPPHHVPTGCMGCFANRGKGKQKPNWGGRAAGRLNTRDKTWNLSLKEITDKKGPIGEVIRGVPLYYPSWLKVPKERKAALITDIRHLQKAYNTNKATFKAQHWVIDPTIRTYDVEKIRRARPEDITAEEWEKYIKFWNDPMNIARAAQNWKNRAKSTSSGTQEYPSLIDTFFLAHTVNGEFLQDEDRRIYEEMRRLEAMGTYTDDEINHLARKGKQRGHIPGVGRVLPARATAGPSGASGSGGCGNDEESVDAQEDEDEDGDGDS